MEPMRPIPPMEPLKAMDPMDFGKPWWDEELGFAATSGGQDGMRYAFFPEQRRLLVERDGRLTTYDAGDHLIQGVVQSSGGDRELAFTSQHGVMKLEDLQKIS